MKPVEVEILLKGNLGSGMQQATAQTQGLDQAMRRLGMTIGGVFSAAKVMEFGKAVIDVRSKIETLQTSFQVLLGDKGKADALFGNIKEFAATTPMLMDDLASGAQTMLGFGIESEKVMEYLKALGDISMGDSQRFQSLTLAFSQMSATGKLMGQDLLQMINAGFNPLKVISEQTGKSIGELKDEMSKGAISADEVQKAFLAAAGSGGQFEGMLDKLSKTQAGALSNLKGAWDDFLNAVGEQTEGVVVTAATGLTDMLHNYEQVGKILTGIITTYGTYKAALMLATAAEGWATAAEALHYNWLLLVERAQKLLNATMLSNPYVLLATVAAGLVAAYFSLSDSTSAAELAQQNLNDTMDELAQKQDEYNQQTEQAISLAEDDSAATSDREQAMQILIARYPQIIQKYIDEEGHLQNILQLKKEIAEYDGKKQRQETTQTLKKAADDADSNLTALLYLKGKKGKTKADNDRIESIIQSYMKETGKWRISATFDNMIAYYRQKAQQSRTRYNRNLTENKITDFTSVGGRLESMTDAQLKTLQKKLRDRQTDGKKRTSEWISEIGDYLTYNDRASLLTRVSGMLTARSQPRSTPGQHKNQLRKERDAAQKALDDFDRSPHRYTQSEYDKRRKELADDLEAKEKAYKAAGGDSVENENAAAARAQRQQQTADRRAATAAARAEREREKEEREAERRKQAMEKLGQELADLQRDNYAAEIDAMKDGTAKKLRQIDNDWQARRNELDKQEADWKRENKKAGAETGDDGLTAEQAAAMAKARKLNDERQAAEQAKVIKERLEAETQAMGEYLKQYGTMEERRLALTQEYNAKIAKAETAGERNTLQAELERQLAELDFEDLKKQINWEDVFGDLGNMTLAQLRKVREELRRMMDDGRLTIDQYKDAAEQIGKVNEAIVAAENGTRSAIGMLTETAAQRLQLENAVTEAQQRQAATAAAAQTAYDNLEAQRDTTWQMFGGERSGARREDMTTANSQTLLNLAGAMYGTDSKEYKEVQKQLDSLAEAERDAAAASDKNAAATRTLTSAEQKLKVFTDDFGNKLKEIGEWIDLVNANVQDLPGLLSEFGVSSESSLGKSVAAFAEGTQATTDAFRDFQSGNFVGAAMNGMKAIGSYVQSATNLFAGAGNEQAMEAEIARLASSNEDLAAAIDDLKDSISDSDNTNRQSVEAYKKAYEAQKEWQENQRQIIRDRAAEYTNSGHGFLGMKGKGSFRKYADRNRGAWLDEFNAALRQAGYNVAISDATQFFGLTPEQMKAIREYAPKAWTAFFNSGGYKNPKDDVEEYIESAGKLDEITDALNEKLTGYSWDSFRDGYTSLIEDMTSTTDDFGDHIEEVLTNAILSALVTEKYRDKIKALYDYIADAASDGEFTAEEVARIRAMNSEIANGLTADRRQLLDLGIIKDTSSNTQSGKSGTFTTMTQDQGTKLEGLFTNNLRHLASIDGQLPSMAQQMTMAESHLARIAENSEYLRRLETIADDVARMRRDGVKAV